MKKWFVLGALIASAFYFKQPCFGCSFGFNHVVYCNEFPVYFSERLLDDDPDLAKIQDCDVEGLRTIMGKYRFSGGRYYPATTKNVAKLRRIDENACDCYYDQYTIEHGWIRARRSVKPMCNARTDFVTPSVCGLNKFHVLPFGQAIRCFGADGDVSPWSTLTPYAFTSTSILIGAITISALRKRRQKKTFSYINNWQDPSHFKNNDI